MLRRFNLLIYKLASPAALAISFILAAGVTVLFGYIVLPAFQEATNGLLPVDMSVPATPETIFEQLPYYTEKSRQVYRWFLLAEITYAPLSAAFVALLWAWFYKVAPNPPMEKLILRGLFVLPFLAALADWIENTAYAIVVFSYPVELWGMAAFAAIVKQIKFALYLIIVALSLVLVVTTLVWRGRAR